MNFHSPSVFQIKSAGCTKHDFCWNMLANKFWKSIRIYCLCYEYEYRILPKFLPICHSADSYYFPFCVHYSPNAGSTNVIWYECLLLSVTMFDRFVKALGLDCTNNIMKTCPYNVDPLTPHFCIGKLGFTDTTTDTIIFLLFALKHRFVGTR